MQAGGSTVFLEQYILLTALRTGCGPAGMAVPRNEWFRCWVMTSFILTLCNHSLLTAVRKNEQVRCCFLVVQQGVQFIFHSHINFVDGGSRTYLWLKLFSFLRQWRVTTPWPSLLRSWLTVHTTGLLALAPRNATPSFSLTLQHKKRKRKTLN